MYKLSWGKVSLIGLLLGFLNCSSFLFSAQSYETHRENFRTFKSHFLEEVKICESNLYDKEQKKIQEELNKKLCLFIEKLSTYENFRLEKIADLENFDKILKELYKFIRSVSLKPCLGIEMTKLLSGKADVLENTIEINSLAGSIINRGEGLTNGLSNLLINNSYLEGKYINLSNERKVQLAGQHEVDSDLFFASVSGNSPVISSKSPISSSDVAFDESDFPNIDIQIEIPIEDE